MTKILIVEDHEDTAFLIQQLVHYALDNVEIIIASTLEDAIPQVEWADLVISDYRFPTDGFPGLLPTLQSEKKLFILQTADAECVKIYDKNLQIAAIQKGVNYTRQILDTLKNIS